MSGFSNTIRIPGSDFADFSIDCTTESGLYDAFKKFLQKPGVTAETLQNWFHDTGVKGYERYSVSLESCKSIVKNAGSFVSPMSLGY